MVEKRISNFSLKEILNSGQCFRMREVEEGSFDIISKDRRLLAKQEKETVSFYCEKEDFESFWKDYFDLDTDYGAYIEKADEKDSYLQDAIFMASGVRILRQDLWEMIVSFLISQQNNIVRIRKCIQNLCEKYGEKKEGYYAFPTPKALADLDEDALKECNLGYRSKYVVRSAKMIVDGEIDLEKIKALPYEEAKEELLKLFGVGVKVADCVCLFGLHHLEAFPIDTHIKQALDAHYKKGFPLKKYKGFEGVMQQYIFYYELHKN